ncbi:MAG: polyphosphate kinase 1 [Dehalococcoidia bacterium]
MTSDAIPTDARPSYAGLEARSAAAAAWDAALEEDATELYANREFSWLDFNDRVLAEADDERNPLLERVRFLAITSSNLDEFYAKRIAWLKQAMRTSPNHRTVDGLTLAEQHAELQRRCADMRRAIEARWSGVLAPALAAEGVRIVGYRSLDAAERRRLDDYFMSSVYPVLTPLVVDPSHPFPFISANSVSLALRLRDPRTGIDRFGRVKVPQNRPRLVEVAEGRFVLLEDLIAAHLHVLFPGVQVVEHSMLRVLRSIEIEAASGEAAEDLLDLVEREVRRRRLAEAVCLEVTGTLTSDREELLLEELNLGPADVVLCEGPLGLVDLHQIAGLPMPHLLFPEAAPPAVPPAFAGITDRAAFFSALHGEDILVHHPYESFDASVVRFFQEAARDPAVLAIKHTTYRTSPDSPILRALIEASTRGKQVAVLVELMARMDEENNIDWARRLEEAGIHVAYGDPGRKIHSKISLVVREEPTGVMMYAHIGTGNYNSRTARVYTDLGLITADPEICGDLLRVFNYLTGFSNQLETDQLLVAPVSLRSELEARIHREIEHARAGRPAHLIFKMNALEDHDFTRLLYLAGRAGVKVDLIVRGISRLRPGVPGLSDNVRVISVIGRHLEHSRVYYFANDGRPDYFIGSADLMKRNLDERIEVLTPVRQPAHQARIDALLRLLLAERRQTWELRDTTWSRLSLEEGAGIHERLLAAAGASEAVPSSDRAP